MLESYQNPRFLLNRNHFPHCLAESVVSQSCQVLQKTLVLLPNQRHVPSLRIFFCWSSLVWSENLLISYFKFLKSSHREGVAWHLFRELVLCLRRLRRLRSWSSSSERVSRSLSISSKVHIFGCLAHSKRSKVNIIAAFGGFCVDRDPTAH